MPTLAPYNVLQAYQDTHAVILKLADSLTDDQLHWKPANYNLSIAFHLWHLAREADFLKARIMQLFPQLGPDFGDGHELWVTEGLAHQWGFPTELAEAIGSGLSDEAAENLPLPGKEALLDYLRRSYAAMQAFVTLLDERYGAESHPDEELAKKIADIRANILVFMNHDNRHLGMMECLKGLQTGKGTATG